MRLPLLTAVFALIATSAFALAPASTDNMSLGSPKAKIQVDEYASASCSHCAAFNNDVFPAFKAKYIDTGKVRYTLHEYLTPPEQLAAVAFLVARCSGPDKYFAVLDDFFHRQATIYETHDLKTSLMASAKVGGLEETDVQACVQDKSQLQALETRVKAAMTSGVTATPTFFVNGQKVEGEITLAQLDTAIAKAKPVAKPKPAAKKK